MEFCFFDWETQSNADLKVVGGNNYARDPSTRPLLLSWAIDGGPVQLWCPDLSAELEPEVWAFVRSMIPFVGVFPEAIRVFSGYWVAWNAAFDRHISQIIAAPEYGFPAIPTDRIMDAMAQASAANLPGKLDMAGRALRLGGKTTGGSAIMKRFADRGLSLPGGLRPDLTGKEREDYTAKSIEEWRIFVTYSAQDTNLLRSVWAATRPLDMEEWRDYWASENINDRGMAVDLEVCAGAVSYREEEADHIIAECVRLTKGEVSRPTVTQQINKWLYPRLNQDLAEFMVKERDEAGKPIRFSAAKDVIARLLEEIKVSDVPPEDDVVEFLELMQYGRASSSIKFEKMLHQADDGRLRGSYVFAGAGQTGRFCVSAETLIETPAGRRRIVDLKPGDYVVSSLWRPALVTDLIFKGVEKMYRFTAPDGSFVEATAAHRVLTETGWRRLDECFAIESSGHRLPKRGCEPLSYYGIHDVAAGVAAEGDARDGVPGFAHGNTERGDEPSSGRYAFAQQDGGSEPDVREEDSGRSDPDTGQGGSVERARGVHFRASSDSSKVIGLGHASEASGGSPHRRGQVEQQPRQLGSSNETRPPVSAQAGTWTVVPLGEREVWDISVRGDESYLAQGLIHHNSSRGIQLHNLPRASVWNELHVLDMVAARVPITELRKVPLTKELSLKNSRPDTSISQLLSRLIRPTIVAEPGNKLVWSDWSAIEARITPWLANTKAAEKAVLTPFRQSDSDRQRYPDVYVINASEIFGVGLADLWARCLAKDKEAVAMRQAGKVACIAEGQQVLTDTGLVPIEEVSLDMKVWDGQGFVSHQGSMFKGHKDVWEYEGLTATLDHVVWTEEGGVTRFGEAIRRGHHLVKSGAGRAALRVGGGYLAGASVSAAEVAGVLRPLPLHRVRPREVRLSRQPAAGEVERVPALRAPTADPEVAGPALDCCEGTLHQPQRPRVEMVRRTRGGVPVLVCTGGGAVGAGEPWIAQGAGARPHRQSERPLRSGEPALGDRAPTAVEQTDVEDRSELGLYSGRMALRMQHHDTQAAERFDARGDHPAGARGGGREAQGVARYRGKVAVYDIVNAGPLHRFTVSGALVHNCLALGFLGGVGALKAMARGYGMKLTNDEAKVIVDRWRSANTWARRFGDACIEAAFAALSRPLTPFIAGRLKYLYAPALMRGTLVCVLPDGRPIVYAGAYKHKVEKFGREQMVISYISDSGEKDLWSGLLVENATQATAASILRHTLRQLDARPDKPVAGHTHDEVICDVPDAMASGFAIELERTMITTPAWAEGLPLAAETTVDDYYHK